MKKVLVVSVAAIVLMLGATSVFAMGKGQGCRNRVFENTCVGNSYVDENCDDVCDYFETKEYNFIDKDCDGICDNKGLKTGCSGKTCKHR